MIATLHTAVAQLEYTYVPFLKPMPIWDYWYLLLLPLTIAISIVYKSVKCHKMSQVPREAATICFWMLALLIAGGTGLWLVVSLTER